MRGGEVGQSDVAECRHAAADHDWRAVEQQAIDESGPQERGGGLRTAFDQKVVHLFKVGNGRGITQDLPTVVTPATREEDTTRGSVLKPRQSYVQLRRINLIRAAPDKDRLMPRPL